LGTYDLFRTIAKSDLTSKERTIEQIQYDILADFYDSPSYQSVTINNASRDVQILDENAITKNPNKKRVLCKPDEDINIGDDILWNSVHWLCTNVDSDKEIYAKGIIERCNNTLTFQLSNGTIKQYPCIITDKTSIYSSGVEENKYLSLADDQILVTVQNNNDIKQLRQDKRFIFNHNEYEIYKLTKVQSLTNEGVLYLTMTKSQKGVNDNLNDNLADYIVVNYSITILNGDIASLNILEKLQLNVQVTNNGVVVESPTITYSTSDEEICTVSTTGLIQPISTGTTIITATSNEVNDSIEVTIEEVIEDNYSIVISGSNTIYQGQSKNYTCAVYNNGSQVSKDCIWSVSDSTLATITAQNSTSCTLKANSSKLGTCVLKCEMVEDNTVFSTISVQIKSIV
jgi:hypothetical protein